MAQGTKVLEIRLSIQQDDGARAISEYWSKWDMERAKVKERWQEIKQYVFATDTKGTANRTLPWSNTTTIPKLCQIRDNLHSNYISALFPNDKWLQWTAYTEDASTHEKAQIITGYMENKAREGGLRNTISRLVLDYIDYGNAFVMPNYESRYNTNQVNDNVAGEEIVPAFIGPRAERISPEDIVFNPLAVDFKYSPKIVRSVKTIGELIRLADTHPDQAFWKDVVSERLKIRSKFGAYRYEDWAKAEQYSIDGFGNLYQYYMSDYVEILEFYGDFHLQQENEVQINRMITVVDRRQVVRNVPINTITGFAPIYHVGWRLRPDNLWGMSPLENLVGMQYRIDHLENLKADAFDLAVWPPLMIKGEVEDFNWGPGTEIHVDENGNVSEIVKNLNAIITADNQIKELEDRMELYSGAPREAMGIRTPGEKTAFEVNQLMTAAGRIFQEKVTNFEINLLEPLLNGMLEQSWLNFDQTDIIRVIDKDLNVQQFIQITRDDITAKGILRPVGARHFSQKSQDLQNLLGIFNSNMLESLRPHISGKELANFVEDVVNINAYNIFRPNIAVLENMETQQIANQAQEDLQTQMAGPSEADAPNLPQDQATKDQMNKGGVFENIPAQGAG